MIRCTITKKIIQWPLELRKLAMPLFQCLGQWENSVIKWKWSGKSPWNHSGRNVWDMAKYEKIGRYFRLYLYINELYHCQTSHALKETRLSKPQRPVMRSFDVFFDLPLNKRLSKQSWDWWFETLSCPLSHHCNGHHLTGTGCWS